MYKGIFCLAAAIILIGCAHERGMKAITLQGNAQGSTFTIKYLDSLERDLSGPVDSIFRDMDHSLSLWDSTSTIARFNADTDTFTSKDVHLRTVLSLSQHLWRSTRHAFDPTVLPLVQAWGLGKAGKAGLDTTAVLALRAFVGMDHLRMDDDRGLRSTLPPPVTYHKTHAAVQFDPNGIAQGYTVDVIAIFLQQQGITDHMVEVGGEVRCSGKNDRGASWNMQIDKPVDGAEHVQQTVVPLQDKSLATSGNYRKFIELGGKRYGHTIDPRTGRPAMNALLSASVIADDCATADALGTALMVMGPDEAKAWLALHPEVDAYLIIDDGSGGYRVWNTPNWPSARIP